jgi:TolB-like protein/predicted Zn-dependent protease
VPAPAAPAIFLSYAREDTAAARRIADALRGFGVEVWFDQNELRGGDTWDQKIRGQIRACTLFLPVISANTQQRPEGYFRREWKIAVERTHDMADGVPFIVPVVIDATPESAALVPEPFMRVQWTRLPGGAPTPEFVAHTKSLLDPSHRTAGVVASAAPTAVSHSTAVGRALRARLGWIVAAVIFLGAGGWIVTHRNANTPLSSEQAARRGAPPTPEKTAAPVAPKVADKSIAVLPFANMSEEKDSAFFADGVHEDILTNLALIRDLKVVSRTTVTQYRDSKKSLRQIGEELGVAYILEGSVRRAGSKVRVTGQLINARTDEHVWAKSYDKDLTDIFAIQAALAQEIAGALEAAISPEARRHLDRRPTENPAAYDRYLQGRDTRNRAPTSSSSALEQAEQLFAEAVALDPKFAAAWGELAVVHALNIFWDRDTSAERKARGAAAITEATRFAPEAPEIIRLAGTYAYYAYRDYERATAAYEKIIRLQPNDPTGYASLGLILRRQGRWAEALVNLRRAVELDPGNVGYARNLLSALGNVRRWDEGLALQRRLVALLPGQLREELALAHYTFAVADSPRAVDELLARLTPEQRAAPVTVYYRKLWAVSRGDYAEFQRLDALQPVYPELETPAQAATDAALMHLSLGQAEAARARLAPAYAEMLALTRREPANLRARLYLGLMEVIRGRPDEGVRLLRGVTEALPETRDALDGVTYRYTLAVGLALAGDKEAALAELARVLRVPSQFPPAIVRADPALHSLRADPRFAALISDAQRHAPLF